MKRFFAKIGRFFWSWGFLKFVLAIIALIIFFYIEEDWRGARAWAATKAEWEAKGESFDYNKFIPPLVPDDQNLAAIPLFKLEPAKNYDGPTYIEAVTLRRAMRDDLPSLEFPQLPSWPKGELPDMAKIKKSLATNYALAFKKATPPDNALAQFSAIYPFFTDFIAATAPRPVFRFNMDYSISPHAARPLGPITDPIRLAKILTLHGILALDQKRPDLALRDLKTNYELVSGVKRDPTLVGGLVAIGAAAIGNGILYDGLAQHEWSDAQLSEIEQILKSMDYLADYQFAFRCEVAYATGDLDFFEHASRSDIRRLFGATMAESGLATMVDIPWPSGWWDDNKSQLAEFYFQELGTVHPKSRLVFPKVSFDLDQQIVKAKDKWNAYAPWKIWFVMGAGAMTNAAHQYAQAQVWIDETRIACALERYRLAHGVYPRSLDAFAPACIDALPHDIMNGQPYHYQLRPDGTYLLYSVGWNQTDDGGKVAFKKDSPTQVDYEQGDWVWPTPK